MSRAPATVDSPASWLRLGLSLALSSVGGVGLWSVVVVLPTVESAFGVARADASLPYSLAMIGFGLGGVLMGSLADRFGIAVPALLGAVLIGLGYMAASLAQTLWQFALAHGLLIGLGSSATFSPLMADITHWFDRRRGIAVAVCASGNYLAGTIWPPLVQHLVEGVGWRQTHLGIGLFCLAAMLPLAAALRGRPPARQEARAAVAAAEQRSAAGLSPGALQALLIAAGVSCCVAMSMPQVHIVAYCGELGYGVARGAAMLSLMLGFGIVSRVGSGFLADRIGGVGTLLLGSVLQGVALTLYLVFDGLTSLYVISALFGLFQGGIVPSYALIVRQYFPPEEAGTRVGLAIMATLIGMSFGGWLSGAIFDLTGNYRAAFANGLAWNLVNVAIAAWLLRRPGSRLAAA
jgi:MFS family permease